MQYDVTIRIIGASNVIKYLKKESGQDGLAKYFTNHFESSLKCNHKKMGVKFRPMGTFNNKAECINNYLHWQLFALLREISQRQLEKKIP
jgi:hypothetical protein